MDRRRKASLLWGLVGALSYLVLLQGYELVTVERVDLGVKFGVAVVVFVGASVVSSWWMDRIQRRSREQ